MSLWSIIELSYFNFGIANIFPYCYFLSRLYIFPGREMLGNFCCGIEVHGMACYYVGVPSYFTYGSNRWFSYFGNNA
jgi:hypothetical protein